MWKTLKFYKKILNTIIEKVHNNFVVNLSNVSLDKWINFDYISGNNRLCTSNNTYMYENLATKISNDSLRVNISNKELIKKSKTFTFRELLSGISVETCFDVQVVIAGGWRNTRMSNDYRLETFDLITDGGLTTVSEKDFSFSYTDLYYVVDDPSLVGGTVQEWFACDYVAMYIKSYSLRDFSEYKHIGKVKFDVRAEFVEDSYFYLRGQGLDALEVIIYYYTPEDGIDTYNSDLNLIAWELQE